MSDGRHEWMGRSRLPDDMTGAFGFLCENENGGRVVDFCSENRVMRR